MGFWDGHCADGREHSASAGELATSRSLLRQAAKMASEFAKNLCADAVVSLAF